MYNTAAAQHTSSKQQTQKTSRVKRKISLNFIMLNFLVVVSSLFGGVQTKPTRAVTPPGV